MANVIQRMVKLVLDRRAAQKTEEDAKRTLGNVGKSMQGLASIAKYVGGVLVAAFSIRAIERFLSSSIRVAREAQQIWNDLAGTIRATGQEFEALEPRIRATAAAFQEATTVGDEDFAKGLTRLISLTGDVESSLNNMGLVANVAAQFFGGKLEPAIELVAKVSTGYITQLQRMGIQVKSAQEGLEVLAERSFGAAARQMLTQEGQISRLNNAWGDFQEAVGGALTTMDENTSTFTSLTEAIQKAEAWVVQNHATIGNWAQRGWRGVIVAIDATYRAISGLSQLFVGFFQAALGSATVAVATLSQAFLHLFDVVSAAPRWLGARGAALIGLDGVARTLDGLTDGLHNSAEAFRQWGAEMAKSGFGYLGSGARRFANRTGLANALLNPGGFTVPDDPTGSAPMLPGGGGEEGGGGTTAKVVDKIGESFERYSEALRVAHGLHQLLGSDFDLTAAKVSALEKHINELLTEGFDPMDPYLRALAEQLDGLRQRVDPLSDAVNAFDREMQTFDTLAAAFGESFDMLGAKASALEGIIRTLADQGFDASSPIMQHYIDQLNAVDEAMARAREQAENYQLAVSNLQAVIVGAVGGQLGAVAKAKAKENLLLAAEQTAHGIVSALNPFTAAKAGGHFAAAAKFTAIAAGWAALSSVAGGGGGGALGGARAASGTASERTEAPGPEISIYLTGDMNALDARVQKWVLGAAERGRERYGNNAIVRTVPQRGS